MNESTTTQPAVSYLVPPGTAIDANGANSGYALGSLAGRPILIILHISEVIEQESLHVSVWGSAEGADWGEKPLFWYPQKFYEGKTPAAVDLRQRPEVKFLQARWEVNRWGRGYPRPYFKIALEVQELITA